MAPGDLNLKKSWNPALMKNQQKVWEAEKSALEERKKIQERQKEIRKERELDELRQLQGKHKSNRLDWMYAQPKSSETTSKDDYLLGKRKLDQKVLNHKKKESLVKSHGFENVISTSKAPHHPSSAQHREDPMLKIREQQLQREQERSSRTRERNMRRDRDDGSYRGTTGGHRSSSNGLARDRFRERSPVSRGGTKGDRY
ncbi:hypothetical protein WICPIJ_004992 [Wickerhamomyces pijperi]|uniref:Pre-mRNA-splicing factor CWC25 n=1 Tax=Wickerhamomyces pijperi TaxID=599730 RepID=A0A9P8TMD2_WICPI|nr:hypothetical protein WICPIJ_004992 [Wickerhamomyces pijperi]